MFSCIVSAFVRSMRKSNNKVGPRMSAFQGIRGVAARLSFRWSTGGLGAKHNKKTEHITNPPPGRICPPVLRARLDVVRAYCCISLCQKQNFSNCWNHLWTRPRRGNNNYLWKKAMQIVLMNSLIKRSLLIISKYRFWVSWAYPPTDPASSECGLHNIYIYILMCVWWSVPDNDKDSTPIVIVCTRWYM